MGCNVKPTRNAYLLLMAAVAKQGGAPLQGRAGQGTSVASIPGTATTVCLRKQEGSRGRAWREGDSEGRQGQGAGVRGPCPS